MNNDERCAPGGRYYAAPKPPMPPDLTPLELQALDIRLDQAVAAYRLSRAIADALRDAGISSAVASQLDAQGWINVAEVLGVPCPSEQLQAAIITTMLRREVKGR